MNSLKDRIDQLKHDFDQSLAEVNSVEQVEKVRVMYIGRKGIFASLMDELKQMSMQEKRFYGPLLQELRTYLTHHIEQAHTQLQTIRPRNCLDVTAYNPARYVGSLHVYTQITEKLENIFISLGFQIADGPEIETEYYNFEALNIPKDHPARDLQDTFWLTSPGLLLRTHTSSVQIRVMQTECPPIALFSPGRVYRNEATDATHEFMFMQAECLYVDKEISMANVLATAEIFLKQLFDSQSLRMRVRPGYFPFVEPGIEIDISCLFCANGCNICKKTGWIEILGAGLVHPHVLEICGIDPTEYSGFAFGVGIERLAMLLHGISDIRLFHSYNMHFLQQL